MAQGLIVITPFLTYPSGTVISDGALMASVLASQYARSVVRISLDGTVTPPPPPPATTGAGWTIGHGTPDSTIGADGGYYLDVDTGSVYGPRSSGIWGIALGSLRGPSPTVATPSSPGTVQPSSDFLVDGVGSLSLLQADGGWF